MRSMVAWVGCVFLVGMAGLGCAESVEEARPQVPQQPQRAVAVPLHAVELPVALGDSFWVNQGLARAAEPPPRAARSISLGYVGDEPLPSGVMRDTPMEQPGALGPGQSWQRYQRSGGWPQATPRPFHVPDYPVAGPGYGYGRPYYGPYNYPQPGWPTCPGCAR